MPKTDEQFKAYACQRAELMARTIQTVMNGRFDIEIPLEDQEDEFEAQIETLVLGFNMMCAELRRLDEIARHELERAKNYIDEQRTLIDKLKMPMMEIWDDILVMPIIGPIAADRHGEMTHHLLQVVVQKQVRSVIIDITGIEGVDSSTVEQLLRLVRAARLLGMHCVLTGVNSTVARAIVQLGLDLEDLPTRRTLKDGLKACFARSATNG